MAIIEGGGCVWHIDCETPIIIYTVIGSISCIDDVSHPSTVSTCALRESASSTTIATKRWKSGTTADATRTAGCSLLAAHDRHV
jgi:hypothetical protein